ncbi:TPR-2 domain protein, putative [Rhizoctonia solani AG-3 Rhs1AP]|uniref:TPR-2 domain protein, putative n=2 Tax=Rhizoctonia solani AG-3 TaxID=1086053 RepID=A0A0A1UKJ7_9AGAM|nr:TPR-2 domain protein, putative [Rhizoctonia solani AG-3 Rhs1AP]KEP50102.1 putative TPR-2 domain protein [Rhizoctonia solani 123E]
MSGADAAATFDPGYRYMPYERVAGQSAAEILKQVDKVLQSSNVVLENHKDYLPTTQFAALKRAYCRYHWQMTNESQEDRAYYDKRIRESRILSQLYANRQTHQDRAKVLLDKVETFQTKVLSASRNTHQEEALLLFEDELTGPPTSSRVRCDFFASLELIIK